MIEFPLYSALLKWNTDELELKLTFAVDLESLYEK